MVPNKGFQHLVAALGLLAREGMQFRATIAGDGELRTTLMAQAEALGIRDRIDFPGWIGPEDKASFFNGFDVVCFTSEWDVQGITILESFAWRKALIGTDVDGPSSCYEDGDTALVVPPMDPAALARALRRLHDDPSLRGRLAAKGREQAERSYSDEVIASLLDRHVCDVVARSHGARARARA
jgi:glycosyltransferase involved in cell wall biosynthesis